MVLGGQQKQHVDMDVPPQQGCANRCKRNVGYRKKSVREEKFVCVNKMEHGERSMIVKAVHVQLRKSVN
jgi:hypothetical protein